MAEPRKPVVVVSACLGFQACRFDGALVPDELVERLKPFVKFVPVCPEVGIGLGVPRDPIRVVLRNGATRLIQPSSGRDLTDGMVRFARRFLENTGPIDAFVLKSRSPSCALTDADRFETAGSETPVSKGPGLFAMALRERLPGTPAEDDRGLMERRRLPWRHR
ncbi:MAG: DUF523 domain-containing protein [Deltaproteobacteria bacterium]|nr:DUF523 domain-containing protein [Deltaproteobacteria bacterium]